MKYLPSCVVLVCGTVITITALIMKTPDFDPVFMMIIVCIVAGILARFVKG